MRVKAHQPIEGEEGEGERESEHRDRRELTHLEGERQISALILSDAVFSEEEGHHPDITFGWGYAEIKITTHAIKGLSENDFILAAKIDQIINV